MAIKLLGEPAILDEDGAAQSVRGHQAWRILARVLLARTPVDRRALAADLFPETVDPLGSLRWALASLRKALDCSDALTGDPIEARLPPGASVDVWMLADESLDAFDAGRLLDGVEPRSSPEFETWLLVERERLAGIVEARLRREAIQALAQGEHGRAAALSERVVARNPFNEGGHVLLVKSLTAAGRYEAALRHVEATEKVFVAELGVKPSLALRSAARRNVASPPGGVSPSAFIASLIESGRAALAAGAVDAGLDCLRRAVGDAARIADRPLGAKAMFELGAALVHSVRGFDDEGAVILRQAVEAMAGRRPSAADYLANALTHAQSDDDFAGAHAVIGFNLVDWGRIDEGIEHYEIALDRARGAGNQRREAWSLGLGARGQLAAARFEVADKWLKDCLTRVDEQRWVAFRPWPIALIGESNCLQRRDPAAMWPVLEEAFALSCQLGDPCWEAAVARSIALSHVAERKFASALTWLDEARSRCVRTTDSYVALQVEILADVAEANRQMGRREAANTASREWLALAARTHMDGHVARAAALVAMK